MFALIWKIFSNEAAFSDLWFQKKDVIIRVLMFGIALAVQKGIIPGGDSDTGWYASLAGMAAALGWTGGDKTAKDLYARIDALEKKEPKP